MCKENKYINIQNGEELDIKFLNNLPNNTALKVNPNIWLYWDFQKNSEINILEITKGSSEKYWWYCEKCDDSYPQAMNKKVINRGCSICKGYYCTKKNSFGGKFPELLKEWDYDKNINISPFQVSYGSGKRVWWRCLKCGESYDNTIDKRTSQNAKCPYCRGLRVGAKNNLIYTHPEIAKLWDYEKNGVLTPEMFTRGSQERIHWKCCKCGKESYVRIVNKAGCKVCINQEAKKGINDIATTNPQLVKYLLNKEDSYRYTEKSNKRVDWKCIHCDTIIKDKPIADVNRGSFPCPVCSDGLSFGEKVVYNILIINNIDFIKEKTFSWSKNKRYDFYIPSKNMIIEINGEQHYNGSFSRIGGRTKEEECENDSLKEALARENGITYYFQIPSLGMDLDLLISSFKDNEIFEILNLDDMSFYSINIHNGTFSNVVKLWNEGYRATQISKILKLSKGTVTKYLKLGGSLNKCNYNPKDRYEHSKRAVLKVNRSNEIIEKYSGFLESKAKCDGVFSLLKYPFNQALKATEFLYVYEDEFIKYKDLINKYLLDRDLENCVYQLNSEGVLIGVYPSIADASNKLGLNYANIHACCTDRCKSSYGFTWLFSKDYNNKYIINE